MNNTLVCIKIGGSVITDKSIPYHANNDAIHTIAKILKTVTTPLLISHGSGSFGHTSAKLYGGMHGYTRRIGIAKVAYDAATINHIVTGILVEEGLPALAFRPMSFLLSKKGECKKNFVYPITQSLKQQLIPVVFGDVIMDESWKSTIFSGETVLTILCRQFLQEYTSIRIIELCDVDGVLDANGKTIPLITSATWGEVKGVLKQNPVTDVTGGMEHKVLEALKIAKDGITTTIVNGNDAEQIVRALHNERPAGTTISR